MQSMTQPVVDSDPKSQLLQFKLLPDYCRFLLENHLEEFASDQLQLSRDVKVPLMKYLDTMPEDQLMALALKSIRELFENLVNGTIHEFLKKSNDEWKQNQLPIVSKDEVVTEDITLISYVRKRSFLKFLPYYTQDFKVFSTIIDEVDRFLLHSETMNFSTYAEILTLELIHNEDLYKQAQAISHLGNWSWNVETNDIKWTDELYRIFGLEPQSEKISFERYVALLHPEDRDIMVSTIQNAMVEKKTYEIYHRVVLHDGSVRFINGKGEIRLNKSGEVIEMVGTAQDVTEDTERKRNEAKLRESEERFRAIADTAPVLMWIADTQKERNWFNKSWLQFTGRPMSDEVGFGWVNGVHPDDKERVLSNYHNVFDTRAELNAEYRLRCNNGEYRWMETHGIPRYEPNGNFIGYIGSVVDIHERKHTREVLEQQVKERTAALQKANHELERSNKELSSFSYVASHDLQEPLRKIQTFSSRLLERDYDQLTQSGKDSLVRMNDAAARMKQLIEDLLAYSRTNTAIKAFEQVGLNVILTEIKSTNADLYQDKNVTITSDGLPTIYGIDYQLNQLFDNLIGNSVKYAKRDSSPRVTISYDEVTGNNIGIDDAEPNQRYHKISVSDNGIGFEQKHAQRIFEVFQRLHNRGEYSGTGIGLAICKKIMENHRGFINASGEPNVGAEFTLYFPLEM